MFLTGNYILYFIISLPALLLGLYAQYKVRSAFQKYSRVRTSTGLSGSEIARRMLDLSGLRNVKVEQVSGFLSDHYDPRHKVLRLSPQVYQSNSLASAGIAAHEAGHAIQDAEGFAFLRLRSSMVPVVQFGSWLGPIIFIVGLMMQTATGETIAWAGLALFAAVTAFTIVTLPVEFNASSRAKQWLSTSGVIYPQEMNAVNSVLDAAALTYVAAAVQAISTLLYYAMLLMGRRRD